MVLFSFLFLKSQICTTPVFSFPWVLASFISGQIHRSFLAWNGCPNFPSKNQVIHVISHLMLILQAWFKVWLVPEMHSVCLNNPFKGDLCTTICWSWSIWLIPLVHDCQCVTSQDWKKMLEPFRASIYSKNHLLSHQPILFYAMGYQGEIEHQLSLNSFTIIMWKAFIEHCPLVH